MTWEERRECIEVNVRVRVRGRARERESGGEKNARRRRVRVSVCVRGSPATEGSIPGKAVSRTRNEAKELGDRVEKIEDLGDEEEEHRLAEVGEDSNHCKGHSGKVTEGVTHKYLRWIPAGNTPFPGINLARNSAEHAGLVRNSFIELVKYTTFIVHTVNFTNLDKT